VLFSPGPKPALGGPVADSYGVDDFVSKDDQTTQRKLRAAMLCILAAKVKKNRGVKILRKSPTVGTLVFATAGGEFAGSE
jgi:hypothetical protein